MIDINSLVRDNIRNLSPYSTARDEYQGDIGIYLDANENPNDNGVNRYPDPHHTQLRERLSQLKGVASESIFVGNGSDEAIDLIFRIFCTPAKDNVVAIAPSYGMYSVAAATNDIELRTVQLEEDFSLDSDKIVQSVDANTKAIFLCSPNNPTGNSFPQEQILGLASSLGVMVVVDEAYIDFSDKPSMVANIATHPNLIILQTLSKAWGMAAIRCGQAISSPQVITYMNRVKYPYNVNKLSQEAALAGLSNEANIALQVAQIKSERERMAASLSALKLTKTVYQSDANFLLVKVEGANKLYDLLIEQGVIVRNRSSVKGCEDCLRITIGTPSENDRVIEILTTQDN